MVSFIKSVIFTKADDYISLEGAEESITSPIGSIVVESGSGTDVSFIIGAGLEDERFIAKVSVNPYVYDMSLWLVDRLSKPLPDFTIKK